MADESTEDLHEITNDMVMAATGSIVRVFEFLAERYGDQFPDDVAINRVFVKIIAGLLGDMFAHFPEYIREDIIQQAQEHITYSQLMTETEFASAQSAQEEQETQEYREYDLANMKPLGNA